MKTFERVIHYLTLAHQSGQLSHTLPSIRLLAEQLKVSRNSVIRAYHALEQQGKVIAQPRKGYIWLDTSAPLPNNTEPQKVTLGAISLDIIGPAQREAKVVFGSANPDTTPKARAEFFRIFNRLIRKELQSPASFSHYQAPPGNSQLREAIARQTHCGHHELSPSEIVITHGAQEGIALALQALTKPGDIVAVESPCFYGILQCIEALGLKVLEIPSHPSEGLPLEKLADALTQWPIKVLLMNPHANNPLGFIMPDTHKAALLSLAEQHDLCIIEDDVFGELIPTAQRQRTLKSLDKTGQVLLCSSLSKTLDPDIRLGWIAAGKYFDQINYRKYVTSLATSGMVQQAAALWLSSPHYSRHRKQIQNRYKQKKALFLPALRAALPDFVHILPPESGFLCWVVLPCHLDGDLIFTQAKRAGISLTPGSLFATGDQYRHCLRFNFSCFSNTTEQLEALNTIGQFMEIANQQA